MSGFLTYYLLTLAYCFLMAARRWNKDVMAGGLGISPGLDTLALLLMCWALAPVDIFLKWVDVYKKAEEARRKHSENTNKDKKVF